MHAITFEEFRQYQSSRDLTRTRIKEVPPELQEAVKVYMAELISQLSDPDEESIDALGPNERYNAMLAVKRKLSPANNVKAIGDCQRCGGTGYILAYSHVMGGKCLACDGSGGTKRKLN